jgi:CheY-like chemotaxis protein
VHGRLASRDNATKAAGRAFGKRAFSGRLRFGSAARALLQPPSVNPRFARSAGRRGTSEEPRGERVSDPSGSGVMHRPWRVLLVDDDDDGREIYAALFTGAGYEVLQAEQGAEAIETTLRRKPDLIVMDLEMPVMGGLEAIGRLKEDARTCAIPVVVLSANGIFDHAKAEAAGCETCLVKPCAFDDLESVVRSIIDASRLEPASRDSVPG